MTPAFNYPVAAPITVDDLLDPCGGRRVLVVGDVMLDDYLWGDVRRICPEAPVPIVQTRRRTSRPGGAGNCAANLVALGADVCLLGVVGNDSEAEQLRAALREARVSTDWLQCSSDRPTTVKTRIMAQQQQVLRIDTEHTQPIPRNIAEKLLAQIEELLPEADCLLLCDYAKGVLFPELAAQLVQVARRRNVPVIVDPKGRDYRGYRSATVIKPNLHELELWNQKTIQTREELHEAGQRLLSELDGTAVLVTQGAEGMTLFQPGESPWHQPAAAPQAVFDVTGAGDTVVSVLALGLACGAPMVEAVQVANIAASIVVGKVGTAVVTPEELRNALGRAGVVFGTHHDSRPSREQREPPTAAPVVGSEDYTHPTEPTQTAAMAEVLEKCN